MAFSTSHHLGPDLDAIDTVGRINVGTVVRGTDGLKYTYVQASAAIAAAAAPGTQVTITQPGSAAAGAGGAYAPIAGVAQGSYFWARSSTP